MSYLGEGRRALLKLVYDQDLIIYIGSYKLLRTVYSIHITTVHGTRKIYYRLQYL